MEKFSATAAISKGWQLTKEYFIISLGLILAYTVLSMIFSFITTDGIVGIIVSLLSWAVSIIFSLGMVRISLNAFDGEEPRFEVFKEMLPRFVSFLILGILSFILVFVPFISLFVIFALISGNSLNGLFYVSDPLGVVSSASALLWVFLLSILPLIYISLRLTFAQYLLVDRGMGAVDAIKMSWRETEQYQGQLLLFYVLAVLVIILGFICLGVGVFVSAIVLIYGQAALYRMAFPATDPDVLYVENSTMVELTKPE